jgi:hypothetical protein
VSLDNDHNGWSEYKLNVLHRLSRLETMLEERTSADSTRIRSIEVALASLRTAVYVGAAVTAATAGALAAAVALF